MEAIDRLSRLPHEEWTRLRLEIEGKGLRVVALDLPTSQKALSDADGDPSLDIISSQTARFRSVFFQNHLASDPLIG